MKILSKPENLPAMINCAHGKDRTGLVTALTLSCLGKSKEYIALDYSRSEVKKKILFSNLKFITLKLTIKLRSPSAIANTKGILQASGYNNSE